MSPPSEHRSDSESGSKPEHQGDYIEEAKLEGGVASPVQKVNSRGIVLIPQPSDDPKDPLNWSRAKKITGLVLVSLAAFAGNIQALANASGFYTQAALYGKTAVQMSYSISAAQAGLAVGPFLWIPIADKCGKCACIFWSLIFSLAMNIWSACMTGSNQYNAFVVSRLFAAIGGSAPTILGGTIITETFFLHDRGKCFAIYSSAILLGITAAGTFSGFIVQTASWTIQFWYNVAFEGVLATLYLVFIDDTRWARSPEDEPVPVIDGFVQRKIATYFLTSRFIPKGQKGQFVQSIARPIRLMLSPVTVCIGGAVMIYFAWVVSVTTFITVYLQEPVEEGGYGFSPLRNAAFTFTQWVGVFVAQLYGHYLNDRLPLIICARNNGKWKPEYRLHSLWVPILVTMPLGLGLFGACLYYHWHYMVLALATFIIAFSGVAGIPPTMNYLVEAFSPRLGNDVMAAMTFYRLVFALTINFFLFPWADKVGVQWVYGMMAFLTLFALILVVVVMRWGKKLRRMNLAGRGVGEEVTVLREVDKN